MDNGRDLLSQMMSGVGLGSSIGEPWKQPSLGRSACRISPVTSSLTLTLVVTHGGQSVSRMLVASGGNAGRDDLSLPVSLLLGFLLYLPFPGPCLCLVFLTSFQPPPFLQLWRAPKLQNILNLVQGMPQCPPPYSFCPLSQHWSKIRSPLSFFFLNEQV